jgi:hypothetical protein
VNLIRIDCEYFGLLVSIEAVKHSHGIGIVCPNPTIHPIKWDRTRLRHSRRDPQKSVSPSRKARPKLLSIESEAERPWAVGCSFE